MRHPDDANPDDDLDEAPLTRDAVTPRGGFMARPGLKAPPRHAVVIRGGDVEPSEDIPVARGSQPPAPKSEQPTQLDLSPPRAAAVLSESLPPPSDMPVVASVPAPDLQQARARQRARSSWTVIAAAAAGLLLGLASIAATRAQGDGEPKAVAAPPMPVETPATPAPVLAPAPETELGRDLTLAPAPSASNDATAPTPPASRQAPAAPDRSRQAGQKRSIF
jgi:hypothetical protein